MEIPGIAGGSHLVAYASIEPPLCSDGNAFERYFSRFFSVGFNRATAMQRWKFRQSGQSDYFYTQASIEPPLCSDGNGDLVKHCAARGKMEVFEHLTKRDSILGQLNVVCDTNC